MGKTTELRKLIVEKLNTTAGQTYHKTAPKDATYPYKTYELTSVAFTDSARDDFELEVDLWDRSGDSKRLEDIADEVEALFNDANLPRPPIFPTFFREQRYNIEDPDKTLTHIQLRFLVQLYHHKEV